MVLPFFPSVRLGNQGGSRLTTSFVAGEPLAAGGVRIPVNCARAVLVRLQPLARCASVAFPHLETPSQKRRRARAPTESPVTSLSLAYLQVRARYCREGSVGPST